MTPHMIATAFDIEWPKLETNAQAAADNGMMKEFAGLCFAAGYCHGSQDTGKELIKVAIGKPALNFTAADDHKRN